MCTTSTGLTDSIQKPVGTCLCFAFSVNGHILKHWYLGGFLKHWYLREYPPLLCNYRPVYVILTPFCIKYA